MLRNYASLRVKVLSCGAEHHGCHGSQCLLDIICMLVT